MFRALAHGHNSKLLCLELVVNMDAYGDREELDAVARNLSEGSSTRKRTVSGTGAGGLNKHLRVVGNTNMGSAFDPRFGPSGSCNPPRSKPRHNPELHWKDLMSRSSQPWMKQACIQFTVAENRILLEVECTRLVLGRKLFGDFTSYSREMDVEIFKFVEVGSAYLATKKPVQPASAIIKFTSTLDHKPRSTDLQILTIHASAHYVFGATNGSLVMADIQRTPATVCGNDGLVLFDIMTHTQEGHQILITTHECTQLCKRLEFDEVFPLKLSEDFPGPEPTEGSEGGHVEGKELDEE
ncbi:hypothetical protein DFH08DRAFT_825434 [Mycena albidolilacea]|uniref:Alpha-type protein kinase domain-containing protein n=1 Tax=Mycena albidolilacea TaxID=1033008 RepID=A0AAD7EA21_9AGAR|nr:hypothetical protein DFH08DRAFT_825434 [Mycena albidolilacea]